MKDSVVKEVKNDIELSKNRLEILQTQLTTHISQLESMMDVLIVKQTEQLSKKFDKKMIFCVNLWIAISLNFANSFL